MPVVSPPSVTALPTPPSTSSPSSFDTRADAFLAALPTFQTQTDALAANVFANATDAAASATTASTGASTATTQASAASASAASAIAAPGTQATSTTSLAVGTGSKALTIQTSKAYSVGQSVVVADTSAPSSKWMFGQITSYNSGTGALVVNVVQTLGSGTIAAWTVSISASPLVSGPALVRRAITGADTAALGDLAKLIDATSGTFTLAFSAVATLGGGWYCYVRNSGTGDITLDPNASETIDGLTSFVMYPGEVRLVQCDGTALRSIVLNGFSRTFTATGTFTKPPGYSVFSGFLWGAGGSGGKSSLNASGGGGGACNPFSIAAALFGASETITIGAGGAAQSTNAQNGTAGGNSTIGSLHTSYGGGAGNGVNGASNTSGGSGGGAQGAGLTGSTTQIKGGEPAYSPATIGTLNIGFGGGGGDQGTSAGGAAYYGGGGGGGSGNPGPGSAGGASEYGGGGGGGRGTTTDGSGGASLKGGSGGAAANASSGVAGTAPAGGGGATRTGASSGAGARGELRIWGVL